ncbi:DUF3515 family protein [Agromyces seonyuensis]|uniref:DUF3515 family protein n=1 Tax=Agromyces seonyuensis TaxID=2662446 RepID=A0A6I4NTW8_9MICO|nr:DUF3515 family protein [Agromyces seonyuensis]MWB97683.1 DUF3515 family protein [Agromyces seonyuensis]
MNRRLPRLAGVLVGAGLLTTALAGCAGTVAVDAAPDAANAACADVSVALPDTVAGQERRETNAQATAAWGDPAAVILRCGVQPLGPTTLPCQTVDGIDWVIDDSDAPRYLLTTYGREPAVEVYLDTELVADSTVRADLGAAIERIPATGGCTDETVG